MIGSPNGTFGAGNTTTARELVTRLPELHGEYGGIENGGLPVELAVSSDGSTTSSLSGLSSIGNVRSPSATCRFAVDLGASHGCHSIAKRLKCQPV
jgi:hypothetical protein